MNRTRQTGMTLIELVIVVVVLALLTGLTMPTFRQVSESARYRNTSHALTVSLAQARMIAISRGHRVTVCPATPDGACTGGADWSSGWIVFLDPARTGQPSTREAILETHQRSASANNPKVHTTPGRRFVRFSPDGMARGSNLTLTICSPRDSRMLGQVVVSTAGRVRSQRGDSGTPCPEPGA